MRGCSLAAQRAADWLGCREMERFGRGWSCAATVLGGTERRRLEEKIRTEDERTDENRGEEK